MDYIINESKISSAPHKHKRYEVIVYIEGDAFFCTQDKKQKITAGNIIIIPPDTIHSSEADRPVLKIYINGEFNQLFSLAEPVIISDNDNLDGTTLAKMIYRNRFQSADYVSSLCSAFAHFIGQNIKMVDRIGSAVNEIIGKITDSFHYCDIDLSEILGESGYAEDYIRAQFKKITGKTPTEFLTNVRIRHACYLIDVYKSSLLLSEIAEKCGYDDYIYFSRRFKQVMGISPQKYKEVL